MTTTATTRVTPTVTDTILAIDLGRIKSVACVYRRATRAARAMPSPCGDRAVLLA